MSGLLAQGATGMPLVTPDDARHGDEDFFGNDDLYQPDPIANYFKREDLWYGVPTFRTPWWPSSQGGAFLGDGGANISMFSDKLTRWDDFWGNHPGGCNGRLSFVGVTRDQFGSPTGGVTVKLFRTSTDQLVSTVLSDASGNYTITTPYYPDGHYLVCYKTASPDIFGTTVNTLIAG